MSIKTDQAIVRVTEECQNAEHLIPFEEYLTSICTTDAIAEKILDEGKTLKGCFENMKNIAKKRAVGGCAYIPNDEGFSMIRDYYGIDLNEKHEDNGAVIDILDYL